MSAPSESNQKFKLTLLARLSSFTRQRHERFAPSSSGFFIFPERGWIRCNA
jgi:hypothetical protein